jgi:hypothetical protein
MGILSKLKIKIYSLKDGGKIFYPNLYSTITDCYFGFTLGFLSYHILLNGERCIKYYLK